MQHYIHSQRAGGAFIDGSIPLGGPECWGLKGWLVTLCPGAPDCGWET